MTKRKKGKKRGRPPGSKNKPRSTVSDAMAKRPAPKLIACEFCGYEFDEACGRYGCPNCNGEGLEPAKAGTVLALMAIKAYPARPEVRTFPIIPTFGDAGATHSLKVVLEDSDWKGFRLMADGESIWLEPYEG